LRIKLQKLEFFTKKSVTQFLFILLVALRLCCAPAQAQEFDRLYVKSIQPALSQPLQWVSAEASAAPSLPIAFMTSPDVWAFAPYAENTVLPTATARDVWAKFSLAPTSSPQAWVIRIPRVTIQKVSLYSMGDNGTWEMQAAGTLIAPASWNRNTRTPSFEVQTSAAEKTYYLRFENHNPLTERPELMSQLDFTDGASRVSALIGLIVGMFGFLIIICFAAFAMAHNSVFLSLAAFVFAVLLHHLVAMGFGGWRLWPGSSHLNQAMLWAAPLLALASGCWFFAQASYAKVSHKRIYQLLAALALGSACLSLISVVAVNQLPRAFLNAWAGGVVLTLFLCLLWLSRGRMRWNWWLIAGLLPLAGSAVARLSYNYGWLARVESAQFVSTLLTQLGLLLLFLALAWRSRDALLSAELSKALANNDPVTGLVHSRVAKMRMSQMLLRADRLKMGCGVIMLRWINFSKLLASKSPEQQDALLKQFGQVLTRVIRDIDTAAVLGDGHFLVLVEGPVSRSALASLSTQILTACIRAAEKFDQPNVFQLHIAIWQAELSPSTMEEVIDGLQTKLGQMSAGTKRPVQFVDSTNSAPEPEEPEFSHRRDELLAKIDAIEALPNFQTSEIETARTKSRR
jgi:two-component system, sensor histidine kinase LadS